MKLSHYLGDKPFWRVTARLALPIAFQNVLTSSFQLVDTMMVSRLGGLTLSAVGMASQWGWLSNLLGFGLSSGMSVFVALAFANFLFEIGMNVALNPAILRIVDLDKKKKA